MIECTNTTTSNTTSTDIDRLLSAREKLYAKSIEDNNKHTILNPGSDVEEEDNIKFKSKRDALSHDFIPYPNAPNNMRLRGHLPAYH